MRSLIFFYKDSKIYTYSTFFVNFFFFSTKNLVIS